MSKIGKRTSPGTGRPNLDVSLKKKGIYIKVSPWVKRWLQAQSKSQGGLIEAALIEIHQLKEPERQV